MESEEFLNKVSITDGLNRPSAAAEPSLRRMILPDVRQIRALTFVQAVPKEDFSQSGKNNFIGFSKISLSLQIVSCENHHPSLAAVSIVSKQM